MEKTETETRASPTSLDSAELNTQVEILNDLVRALQQQRDSAHNVIAQAEARFAQFRRATEKQVAELRREITGLKVQLRAVTDAGKPDVEDTLSKINDGAGESQDEVGKRC